MVVRIYFEGGRHLRESFGEFFRELHDLARERRGRVRLISGGATAVQDFMTALHKHPDEHVVLLIDCEGAAEDCSPAKLQRRFQSVWKPPRGVRVDDGRVFRMTQIMESWFLADRRALQSYYQEGFQENALPGHADVEQAPKQDVLNGLESATRRTRKGAYSKTSHATGILRMIDPQLIRAASPECDRIFTTLTRVITSA